MKKLLVAVLVLAVIGAGAWVVATRMESPDQVAARAAPPDPVPVVASLTRGYLHGPVSVSTVAVPERVVAITPPTALTGVVTGAVRSVGETLSSGSVLLRVNSRPVFVLCSDVPLFRDIQPGDSGDDVSALQAGLVAAGYGIDRDGVFGPRTQAAVRAMYRAAGYGAPTAAVPVVTDSPGDGPAGGGAAPTEEPTPAATPTPAGVGTVVLRSEVMTLAALPAMIQAVAPVGTELTADTTLATLGAGTVVLSATVPTSSVGPLTVGAAGQFVDDAGALIDGTVVALTPTADGDQTVIVTTPSGPVTLGASYLLNIENPANEVGDSLLAPITGIVTRGGRSYVYPREGESFREVEVTVTGTAGGVAAVAPVRAQDDLDSGMEIRVG